MFRTGLKAVAAFSARRHVLKAYKWPIISAGFKASIDAECIDSRHVFAYLRVQVPWSVHCCVAPAGSLYSGGLLAGCTQSMVIDQYPASRRRKWVRFDRGCGNWVAFGLECSSGLRVSMI